MGIQRCLQPDLLDSDRQEAANFPAYQNSPRHVGPEERPAVSIGSRTRRVKRAKARVHPLESRQKGEGSDLLSRPAGQQPSADERTNFVVSQGQGALNRTFMQARAPPGVPNVPKDILVFAGVRTGSGQGLVDSAAEEGVIGSGAFARCLRRHRRKRPWCWAYGTCP